MKVEVFLGQKYKAGLPWVNWGVLLPSLKMLDEEHFFGETSLSGGNTFDFTLDEYQALSLPLYATSSLICNAIFCYYFVSK